MAVTSDMISQLAKITNDNAAETKKETTVYGTIVEYNEKKYVRLDGSDLLTPISATANTTDGERVMVTIKNHTAIVTGNMSSPAARLDDLTGLEDAANKITEFEIAIGNKVDTEELVAANARIDELVADDITIRQNLASAEADIDNLQADNVTIKSKLTAAEASITELQTEKLDADLAEITYATITDLDATNVDIHNLEATFGEFESLTTTKLESHDAVIDSLSSTYATIKDLEAEQARIDVLEAGTLNADSAIIKQLQAEVADIDTLIFGSASGDVIQSSFANAVIAQLGNAQIKSAMIESLSADKITAGDIMTNNVRVMSKDGKLLISDETIQITDTVRVRVQIGKDASGDYSINVWDADGKLMFSEGGITDNAIKDAIIRDDMVSDTANISAHKLNIESLFEEINGGNNTIKSSKIFLDSEAQTLDVVFTDLTTQIDELEESVSSQGTQLSVVQGQISSKVWQQDIDSATDEMSTKYSSLEQTVDDINLIVANHTTEIANKADESTVTEVINQVSELNVSLSGFQSTVSRIGANEENIASLQLTADGLTARVTNTEAASEQALVNAANAQSDIDELSIGGRNLYEKSAVLDINAIGGYFSPTLPPYTITAEVDETAPSGKCVVCTIGEVETAITNGGFYLNADFGNYIPKMIEGETYTVSVWVKGSRAMTYGAITAEFIKNGVRLDNCVLSTEWQRFIVSGTYNGNTTSSVAITFYYNSQITSGDVFYFSSPQIEKGTRPTDWTSAPEDMATSDELANIQSAAELTEERLTTAESVIQLLSDSISTLVTDGNGESLMKQTTNGWTFSMGQIQSIMETTSENLSGLTDEMGNVSSTVKALQQAVNDLGVLNEYIKIGIYEDEPCIELGELDSDFKLLITNTRIMFMEGSGVPAYLNNQSLFIKKAVVEEELQQGEFVWKARSNGNLGLIWKGVTN